MEEMEKEALDPLEQCHKTIFYIFFIYLTMSITMYLCPTISPQCDNGILTLYHLQ